MQTALTFAQEREMMQLKRISPFRIVYGAVKNGEWTCAAVHNMRIPNKLMRQGYTVFVANLEK